MEKMQEVKQTTCSQIAEAIIADYAEQAKAQGRDIEVPSATLHRRIYDVICVMSVVGFIQKKEKVITWIGGVRKNVPQQLIAELAARRNRVASKEEMLRYKLNMLLLLKTVVVDNSSRRRSSKAIQLPCLLLATNSDRPVQINREKSGHRIEFESIGSVDIFSPIDVLMEKRFDMNRVRSAIDSSAALSECKEFLQIMELNEDV
jgi:hypothetical protein